MTGPSDGDQPAAGWAILKDPELGVAALVAIDPPLALGPTCQGDTADEAAAVLEEFVGLLGHEPDEMPFGHLWEEWRSYIDGIVSVANQVKRDVEARQGDDEGQVTAQAVQEAVMAAESTMGDGDPIDDLDEPPAVQEAPQARPDGEGRGDDGTEPCWMCLAKKVIDGPKGTPIPCPVCNGSGAVPITSSTTGGN